MVHSYKAANEQTHTHYTSLQRVGSLEWAIQTLEHT